jgi:hypothetical protein
MNMTQSHSWSSRIEPSLWPVSLVPPEGFAPKSESCGQPRPWRHSHRGLLQEALAFECGLHRTYISGVKRGVRNPTIVVLERIAEALGIPAASLLEEPSPRSRRR